MSEHTKVLAVGIGMGGETALTKEAEEAVKESDCLIGARRMLERFEGIEKPRFISYDPEEIRDYIEGHPEYGQVAVLYSGDTGFYSGAKKLAEIMGQDHIKLIPGISSAAYLAAKLQTSWEDAKVLSLHGRWQPVIHTIARHRKTFLLLGDETTAVQFCGRLKEYELSDLTIHIGRNLSYTDEEIITRKVAELKAEDLSGLVTVLVENEGLLQCLGGHIRDEAFIRGNVPMTKDEVRTVSIAKLELPDQGVVYDIGAGTGSIAVEAAHSSSKLTVYAIEKNTKAIPLIRQNRIRFCTDNLKIIEGEAPKALEGLEPPTHVFIGGSAGNLREILSVVLAKNEQVKIVLNAISLETIGEVVKAMDDGLLNNPEITQISVAKTVEFKNYHMMNAQNPVYIISSHS